MAVDLHQHSTYSDGTDSVAGLVERATRQGVTAISLTDHDTMAGVAECRKLAERAGISFVGGVEFESSEGPHVLGYFKTALDGPVEKAVEHYRDFRIAFLERMVHRLQELGVELGLEAVLARAGAGTPHMGHLVAEMHSLGHLATLDRTNAEYGGLFGPGAPAETPSVEEQQWEAARLVRALRDSGAVAVLAHPSNPSRLDLWPALVAAGLQGVEAYHRRNHIEGNVAEFCDLAEAHGLIVTGGWDHHGEAQATMLARADLRDFAPPDRLLAPLLELLDGATA